MEQATPSTQDVADSSLPPPTLRVIPWASIWRVIGGVLATLVLLWALFEMRTLVWMIVISIFLSLALEPAVRWLRQRYGWSRGASVGVIYSAGIAFLVVLVLVLIPAIVELAERIVAQGPEWVASLNDWTADTFGFEAVDEARGLTASDGVESFVAGWASEAFGAITGIASAGVSFVFSLATIAMFTFYFTADSARITRIVLSWFKPETQQRIGWTLDEAITQTGGYFYSRTLLMILNSVGFGVTMSLVGVPVSMSVPLALFGGFVSVFIPVIGTYIGAAVPIAVTLALEGFGAALILLVYVLLYQAVENYWLSPKLSAEAMSLSGSTAFGAALAGGAIAGPMGAFLALPTAALVTSFVTNYATTYHVVYESGESDDVE